MSHGCENLNRQNTESDWPVIDKKPYFESDSIRLYFAESMEVLGSMQTVESSKFDAIITDPPYCSGADTKSGRDADPASKYCHGGNTCGRPSFAGDHRDSRSFEFWATMWLALARRHCKRSSYCLTFIDWRNLPLMVNIIQAAGFVHKGVCVWDKGRAARAPHKGYFRHQAEYIPWGTNGPVPKLSDRGPFDGVYQHPIRQADKHHITGKPTPLMRDLVKAAPIGGLIFDPFAGSGSTGVAAAIERRRAVLIEQSEEYCEIAAKRLDAAIRGEIMDRKT
ncbi:DNA methyltransferase [Rubinisphaera sp.]|uniref:DNA-methyltransferase n=1 Tax=Rubinisphaera sp. TaxID=2024857 RepID=UPI000C0E11D3|nr:DNA methyltransferase [Rubinisphaera sp.]MBV07814.1 DNA methylase [Rubinisphaera sp.]HCS53170.1 DNA methylase [Planctomycetaceae bacterium]